MMAKPAVKLLTNGELVKQILDGAKGQKLSTLIEALNMALMSASMGAELWALAHMEFTKSVITRRMELDAIKALTALRKSDYGTYIG